MITYDKKILLGAASVLGLAVSAPAWAASDPVAPDATAQAAPAPATAAVASNDEIVVTARRRAERLTDVPVSVTVLSGDTLAAKGVARVDDLQLATPGLKMAPTAGRRSNSQYELRGITTIESLITEDPAVGIYVDDVYRARATGTNQSFYDVSNVQVLYGPQGTLFGRNSTGGAIVITSNRPTDRLEGSIEAGYGNFNQYRVTAMLNVPLSDSFQIRLAGERHKMDGYVLNSSTGNNLGGADSWSGRFSARYHAGGIDNSFVASYYTANDGGTPTVLYGFRSSTTPNAYGQVPALAVAGGGAFVPLVNAALAAEQASGYRVTYLDAAGATIPTAGGPIPLTGLTGYYLNGSTLENRDPFEKPRNFSISNTTVFQLGSGISLKNIFGYNYTRLDASTDLDGTPLKLVDTFYHTTNHQVSDEVQLSGQSPRFNWVVGGLYFKETGLDYQPAVQFVALYGTSNLRGVNTSVGIFGQGTYKLTDKLSLTGGARWTWDRREADFSNMLSNFVGPALATNGGLGTNFDTTGVCGLKAGVANNGSCGINLKKNFAQPSYTISLDWKPIADTLFYVAHRRGYRSGGFNSRITLTASAAQQLAQTASFNPEKINDVEIGYKGNYRLGDFRLRASIALYDSWYTNIQKQTTQFINGTGVTIIQNSGSANVKGFEADFGISPAGGFSLDGFLSYTDGKYHDFPVPLAGAAPASSIPFATAKTTAGITATVTPMDNELGRLSAVLAYSYRSSYYGDNALPTLNPEAKMPAQNNVNLTLGLDNISHSGVSASFWVRNLTNELHYLGVIDLVPSFGIAVATIGEPRTYGFTLKYQFGR